MRSRPLPADQAKLLALWRTAHRAEALITPYHLLCPTPRIALALRTALFQAIRPYRLDPYLDPELHQAANELTLSVISNGPHPNVLTFRAKIINAFLNSLDLVEAEPKSEEDSQLDSLAEMIRKMEKLG